MIDTSPAKRFQSETSKSLSTQVSLLTTRKEVDALVPEWTQLFYSSAVPNPFAHPIWLMTWFDHYGRDAQPYVVTVREQGQLRAVAPFYLEQHKVIPGMSPITRVRHMGVGSTSHITEMAQVLTSARTSRKNLRTIVAFLGGRSHDWDWLEFTVTPEQVFFEPDWVVDPPFEGYVLDAGIRPAVVLPLPASWDELRSRLKPKKREDIRRGYNLLRRGGHGWELTDAAENTEQLREQLRQLVALSRTLVDGDEDTSPRSIASATEGNSRFLDDAAGRLFESGILQPYFLKVDESIGAGRLTLRANGAIFFSFAAFDPRWSDYGLAATLMAEILRASIANGDTLANLSFFPRTAKLRWSEQLEFHHNVILVGTRRRSRIAFTLWWQRQAFWAVRRAATWARSLPPGLRSPE